VGERMQIEVHYFAAFREAAGIAKESVETGAETAAELFAECVNRHPLLEDYPSALVAVNEEMSNWEHKLADGDAVLFFPPVAGG